MIYKGTSVKGGNYRYPKGCGCDGPWPYAYFVNHEGYTSFADTGVEALGVQLTFEKAFKRHGPFDLDRAVAQGEAVYRRLIKRPGLFHTPPQAYLLLEDKHLKDGITLGLCFDLYQWTMHRDNQGALDRIRASGIPRLIRIVSPLIAGDSP